MNLKVLVNKNTGFYYWVQAISMWDPSSVDPKTFRYFTENLPQEYQLILEKIKAILNATPEPRWVLAELYSGKVRLEETRKIRQLSKPLTPIFDSLWEENVPVLEKWREILESTTFNNLVEPMRKIANFLDSDFILQNTYNLYLVQNPPYNNAVGLAINRDHLLLLRPDSTNRPSGFVTTMSVLAHEYIHGIEQESQITRALFKTSYEQSILANNISAPLGYSWKMLYIEALIYCFSSTIHRGYLSPEIFGKPRPTVSEMQDGFKKLAARKRYSPIDIANWAGLTILPDVEKYINHNQKIDQSIVNKIGMTFVDLYNKN